MAVGIGVSTALFSVVDGVLLRPLPYPHPERLVALYTTSAQRNLRTGQASYADFADWRAQSRSFEAMAAFHASGVVLGGAEPQHVPAARVTGGFFDVFGIPAERGRVFGPEAGEGQEKVVVLSHGRSADCTDEAVVGRTLVLDGVPSSWGHAGGVKPRPRRARRSSSRLCCGRGAPRAAADASQCRVGCARGPPTRRHLPSWMIARGWSSYPDSNPAAACTRVLSTRRRSTRAPLVVLSSRSRSRCSSRRPTWRTSAAGAGAVPRGRGARRLGASRRAASAGPQ
jgi:hypothetical protein